MLLWGGWRFVHFYDLSFLLAYYWGCARGFGRGTLYMKWRASSYLALGYLGDLDWHRASARASEPQPHIITLIFLLYKVSKKT